MSNINTNYLHNILFFLIDNEQYDDDWSKEIRELNKVIEYFGNQKNEIKPSDFEGKGYYAVIDDSGRTVDDMIYDNKNEAIEDVKSAIDHVDDPYILDGFRIAHIIPESFVEVSFQVNFEEITR